MSRFFLNGSGVGKTGEEVVGKTLGATFVRLGLSEGGEAFELEGVRSFGGPSQIRIMPMGMRPRARKQTKTQHLCLPVISGGKGQDMFT